MQHHTDPILPPITGSHHPVPPGSVDPFPDREHVPAEVEQAFDHPEKVGHPDGVPHDVVGRVALSAVFLAAIGVFAYFAFGVWIALTVGVVAIWILLRGLPRQARKERTVEAFHDIDDLHHHRDPRERGTYSTDSKDHV